MTACGPGPDEPGTGGREALGASHSPGPGDHPVDVRRRQPGVADRLEARIEREREHAARHAAPDLGLADAGDDAAILEALSHGHEDSSAAPDGGASAGMKTGA